MKGVIILKYYNYYKDWEVKYLEKYYGKKPVKDIAIKFGRSYSSVKEKARQLGLAKKGSKPWKPKELLYIESHSKEQKYADIAKVLGRSEVAVRTKLSLLGIHKNDHDWDEKSLKILNDNYVKKTASQLAIMLNKKTNTIQNKAFNLGLLKPPMYKYNKRFFKVIDCESKAYWLGFLYADGCVRELVGKARVEIGLKAGDLLHLEKFVASLEGDIPVKKSSQGGCRLSISCTEMTVDLIRHGCIPNKTYHMISIPKLQKELIRHFIRGFLDGDGWVNLGKVKKSSPSGFRPVVIGFCSFYDVILKEIEEQIRNESISAYLYKGSSVYTLTMQSKQSVYKMIEYLYNDANIFLDRKYDEALAIMKYLRNRL